MRAREDAFDILTAVERNALVEAARQARAYVPKDIGYREVAKILGLGRPGGRGGGWAVPPDYQQRVAAELIRIREKVEAEACRRRAHGDNVARSQKQEQRRRRLAQLRERARRRARRKEAEMAEEGTAPEPEPRGPEAVGEAEPYPVVDGADARPVPAEVAASNGSADVIPQMHPLQEAARVALEAALADIEERETAILKERRRVESALNSLIPAATLTDEEVEEVLGGPKPPEPLPPDAPPAAETPEPDGEEDAPPDPGERLDEREGAEEEEPAGEPLHEKAEAKEELPPTTAQLEEFIVNRSVREFQKRDVADKLGLDTSPEKWGATSQRIGQRLKQFVESGRLEVEGAGPNRHYVIVDEEAGAEPSEQPRTAQGPRLEDVRDWVVRNHKDGEPFWPAEVHVAFRAQTDTDKRRVSGYLKQLVEMEVLDRQGVGSQTQYSYVRPVGPRPGDHRPHGNGGPPDGVTGVDAPPDRGRTVPGTGGRLLTRAPR